MLRARCDRRLLPSSAATRRVQVELRVPEIGRAQRRPLCLGLVLDRSGSMAGDKLALTQHAATQALRALRPGDQVSVVTYSDDAAVLIPSTSVTAGAVEPMVGALRTLHAGGWTDLAAGWLSGCAQVGEGMQEGALGRCLLLTDGLANRGIVDGDELVRHAGELRRRGVTTSTLGVGDDFDEGLLQRLSDAGGGHFYYARGAAQIPTMVAAEVGESLEIGAREARLWVRTTPGVLVTSMNGDPWSREGDRWCIKLGALRSAELRSSMLELTFPAGSAGQTHGATFAVSDRDGVLPNDETVLSWTHVSDAESEREPPDLEVVHEGARLEVAATHLRALAQLRQHDDEAALACVDEQIEHMRRTSGDDPALLALLQELERDRATYERQYDPVTGKPLHFRAYLSLKQLSLAAPQLPLPAIMLTWFEPKLTKVVQEAEHAMRSDVINAGVTIGSTWVQGAARFWGDEHSPIAAEEERRMVEVVAGHSLTVAFTLRPHRDNWFSHWHEQQRVALVSLHGWERVSSIPRAALVAYEALLHGLRVMSPQYDPVRLLHRDTRGCLFDFCERKEEVEIKLQAGHICDACTERLCELGFDPKAVARVWSGVQQLAHVRAPAQVGS
jgi:Ca-activated chloride channel family protein